MKRWLYPTIVGVYFLSLVATALLLTLARYVDNDPVMGGLATAIAFVYVVAPLFIIGTIGILIGVIVRIRGARATRLDRVLLGMVIASFAAIAYGIFVLGMGI